MSEFDQLKEQKDRIVALQDVSIFDAAMDALRAGAPGISEQIRQGIARSIVLKLSRKLKP